MDDSSLTQLFMRMDTHQAQQDEYLTRQDVCMATLLEGLRRSNEVLAQVAQMLAETRRDIEASNRESQANWAAEREAWTTLLRELRDNVGEV